MSKRSNPLMQRHIVVTGAFLVVTSAIVLTLYLTFSLLIAAYGLRVFAPEWAWNGTPAHQPVRSVALVAAFVSISLALAHGITRLRGR